MNFFKLIIGSLSISLLIQLSLLYVFDEFTPIISLIGFVSVYIFGVFYMLFGWKNNELELSDNKENTR